MTPYVFPDTGGGGGAEGGQRVQGARLCELFVGVRLYGRAGHELSPPNGCGTILWHERMRPSFLVRRAPGEGLPRTSRRHIGRRPCLGMLHVKGRIACFSQPAAAIQDPSCLCLARSQKGGTS